MTILDLFYDTDSLVNHFFYGWDKTVKPPVAVSQIIEGKECRGVKLQFALAGFRSEDIKVYAEKNVLIIEGSNSSNAEVLSKFINTFSHKFAVAKDLNLDKAETSFKDGLLTISIPLVEKESIRTYLFGSK